MQCVMCNGSKGPGSEIPGYRPDQQQRECVLIRVTGIWYLYLSADDIERGI